MTILAAPRVRHAHALLVSNCFYPLVMGSMLAISFWVTRCALSGSMRYRFLLWNLFLAWLPYLSAVGIAYLREELRDASDEEETRRKRRRFMGWILGLGIAWILTLPNAPYILTDVVHLMNGRRPFRWWFDAGLVLSFALTGCFLGVASLRIMHELVREWSSELMGWAFVIVISALSGLGIYLGRFLRFNSWDVVTDPWSLLRAMAGRILDPTDHPQMCGVTLMFAALVFACYAMFRSASCGGVSREGCIKFGK